MTFLLLIFSYDMILLFPMYFIRPVKYLTLKFSWGFRVSMHYMESHAFMSVYQNQMQPATELGTVLLLDGIAILHYFQKQFD